MTALSRSKKRVFALVLALALIIVIALVAATSGLGRPGIPGDAVAEVDGVDNGTVTRDAYEHALDQSIARLGIKEVPPPSDPQFAQINDETMQGLLLAIWAEGEAEDRGIEVSDDDVQAELDDIAKSFKTEEEFAKVATQSKFCTEDELADGGTPADCADVQAQARLLALERQLSDAFQPTVTVSDADAQDFYDANKESFETPATRSARVILNEDQKQVEAAQAELEGLSSDDPDFDKTWKAAAKKYSQDQASKDRGGLLEGLVEGQGDPQLDEQVFSAPVDELTGPFETDRGFYLVQVVDDQPASTQPFDEAKAAIKQQLQSAREQAAAAEVQADFIAKWQRRTSCIDEVMMQFCRGFVAPDNAVDPATGQPATATPAPVNSTSPIAPGTATLSIDGNTTPGLPQGPPVPESAAAAPTSTGLPAGAVPVGPDGAPVTGAPTTGAPPTTAP